MNYTNSPFRKVHHEADLCVVGGGMAGICAAVAAARHGAQVVLMQDRPMLGGNASGEIGIRILGADRSGYIPYVRETGILEELRLDNLHRNPQASLPFWDLVVYSFVRQTPNLTILLNCSCMDASMADSPDSGQTNPRIASVTGWQLSTQTWHKVTAQLFADCSGDGILAPLTGADHRMGREAASEFGESLAPPVADKHTMGMSYGYNASEHSADVPFIPFGWERTFKDCNDLPWGAGDHAALGCSPWWCEMGGEHHPIHDSELLRDELFKHNLGLWNHIKNGTCEHRERAKPWAMDRISFVPGRRESRRYRGLHMLSQNEITEGGHFEDTVCHGGWSMDDHHPAGCDAFRKYNAGPTVHHDAPSPYGIPYRCLVSVNIENLMFAGRVASCTHMAMSSTRIMGTCAVMGQVLGTAAAMACDRHILPGDIQDCIGELQQQLLDDDVFIPGVPLQMSELTRCARLDASQGNPEPLRDGINRPTLDDPLYWLDREQWKPHTDAELAAYEMHSWQAAPGDWVAYTFDGAPLVSEVVLILDSNLARGFVDPSVYQALPPNMPKAFRVEIERDGQWEVLYTTRENCQRQVRIPVNQTLKRIRLTLDELYDADTTHVYGFYAS